MKQFEYKCVYIGGGGEKTSRILNEYGNVSISLKGRKADQDLDIS